MVGAGEFLVGEGERFGKCGLPGKLWEEETWYCGGCGRHFDGQPLVMLRLMDVDVES